VTVDAHLTDDDAGMPDGKEPLDAVADAGADATEPTDAGEDTGADAGPMDAGLDATRDASDAASEDAGLDASIHDAGEAPDATDGSADASDKDAGVDAAPIDAGPVVFVPGVQVSTLAGSGVAGALDGDGGAAQFNNPTGIAVDAQGNLLVTDYTGSLVRRVTPLGVVTTLAAATDFTGPFSAVVATDGTYYVGTDFDTSGAKNATSGTIWRVVPLGDGGIAVPSVVAQGLDRPRGLAAVGGGNLFVADRDDNVVETLTTSSGTLTFLAGASGDDGGFQNGAGTGALFNEPIGCAALSPSGDVLVADLNNNRIRSVTPGGAVTTFAGNGYPGVNDGPVATVEFNQPRAVAVDTAGDIFVSDAGNHRIRRILADGTVATLAGNGTAGYADGAGAQAQFYGQEGIAVAPDGLTVYVADGNMGDGSAYNRIRVITIP
jgi:sugar lactone lactonase YvrE